MAFHVFCLDKPGAEELRSRLRPAHVAYIVANRHAITQAGRLSSDDELTAVGSALIVNCETRTEVETFLTDEPYFKAGLFESVVTRRITVFDLDTLK